MYLVIIIMRFMIPLLIGLSSPLQDIDIIDNTGHPEIGIMLFKLVEDKCIYFNECGILISDWKCRRDVVI